MRIIVFNLIVIAFLWHHKTRGYFEPVEEVGCDNTEFRLSCGSLNESIVIFEAVFSQNEEFSTLPRRSCQDPSHSRNESIWKLRKLKRLDNSFYWRNSSNGTPEISFRHAINRRKSEIDIDKLCRWAREDGCFSRGAHPSGINYACWRECFVTFRDYADIKVPYSITFFRCSGVNYCSFVLKEDFEAASVLGPGAVHLRYACVHDVHSFRPCNSNVDVTREGFVRSPGYPDYYTGDTTCAWLLKAPPLQRVRVAFLDISLRGLAPFELTCLDRLTVSEEGLNILSTCGDVLEDTLIVSDGSALNVTFKSSSRILFPKRGFLLHYKAVGCPSLQKPRDGYLVNRNETFAHYRCGIGFMFPDTLSRDKILKCYNENTWDGDILDCVNVTELSVQKNSTDFDIVGARKEMENPDSIKDIIVPSIIMCILFIGNGLVLYLIYRKRNKLKATENIEVKELSNLSET